MVHLSVKLRAEIVPGINGNFENNQWKYLHLKHNEKIDGGLSRNRYNATTIYFLMVFSKSD